MYLCDSDRRPSSLFFYSAPATTETYTLSLHDALPIYPSRPVAQRRVLHILRRSRTALRLVRSEEHTSELQSRFDLVCRLLLEKKKKNIMIEPTKVDCVRNDFSSHRV